MSGVHARNAPSSAYVWMKCPGSVALCANLPDESSIYAAEGTAAHTIHEECLRFGLEPDDYVGSQVSAEGWIFTVTEEWARYLQPGIDRARDFGGKLYVEKRVYFDRWGRSRKDQFGRLDAGIIKRKIIPIIDLKFGAGVPVDPEENEQLMIYALGFWDNIARHETDADEFLLIIDQPRAAGGGGEWRISLRKLLKFGEKVKKAVEATYKKNAPLVPGAEQCRFCRAAELGVCPAYAKFCMELTGQTLEDLDDARRLGYDPCPPKASALTPTRRSFIALHAPMFRKWIDSIHGETLSDALAGMPTPGLKAVNGRRGARYWLHAPEVERRLKRDLSDEAFNKELKSPAQVEAIMSEADFKKYQKFIDQSEGKPSLVPEDHRSAAITPNAVSFKNRNH